MNRASEPNSAIMKKGMGEFELSPIKTGIQAVGGKAVDDDFDDYEPLIFDIEEVECRMTDIDERERSDTSAHNRSVRGSIMNSPKDSFLN